MKLTFDDFDEKHFGTDRHSDFEGIISKAMSRRDFIGKSALLGLSTVAVTSGMAELAAAGVRNVNSSLMGFNPVTANSYDSITLPDGYSHKVLISWGDPLFSNGTSFDEAKRGTAQSQAVSFGDNNDGMEAYPISKNRAIIAVNNEYTNLEWLLPKGEVKTSDDVAKNKNAHGISIFEIVRKTNGWEIDLSSKYNRRITPDTKMEITGVARGSALLKTSQDSRGTSSLGTWNNCGAGRTPWGTYLTCEENFNGYFASTNGSPAVNAHHKRYGVSKKDWGYGWYKEDPRFDISKEPNEPNRAGYIVEIDVEDPSSVPRKLTSLGRMKHENAELVVNQDGRVVVYMGDDERGEYLYKFVSRKKYDPSAGKRNNKLLENGTLYVAKFGEADGHIRGRGEWIALLYGQNKLTRKNGFNSQADIQVFARKAADIVGATTMDRPEWVAANPHNSSVYCCLTNNKNRGKKKNSGGIEQLVNGPNMRIGNNYGQIVRWIPDNDDHAATEFSWDLFVVAGNPMNQDGLYAGTANITAYNMFNSPDGIKFDQDGRLWIQTDGKYSNAGDYEGMGNNQMLCADTLTGEIRRFLVGPIACEVTGLSIIDGGKTMFVGIQHPGENLAASTFPYGGVPRSSVIVITKSDGGIIGS